MNTIKSIRAVVYGFIAVVALSVATDMLLERAGLMPTGISFATAPFLLALLYRTVYTILGGYIVARMAPQNPMKHAIVFGCIGIVFGTMGALANGHLGPIWYPWALVILSVPSVWLGAKFFVKKQIAKPTVDANVVNTDMTSK